MWVFISKIRNLVSHLVTTVTSGLNQFDMLVGPTCFGRNTKQTKLERYNLIIIFLDFLVGNPGYIDLINKVLAWSLSWIADVS